MEEKLIEAVRKHEVLYKKSSLLYRNRFKRAAAWKSIADELNVPENVCQSRWKTLRDRYVKVCAESYHASGSAADLKDNQWAYQQQMEFLREHIKPRRTITSLPTQQTLADADRNSGNAPYFTILEDHSEICEDFVDTSFLDEELTISPSVSVPTLDTESSSCPADVPHSSRKRPRRENDSEAFSDFLNKMTKIAETRFTVPSPQKESGPHEGFFSMVREIFEDLPNDDVKEAKFFFINYLHNKVAANKKNTDICKD